MDARTVFAIFASTTIAGLVRAWWSSFKERKAREPIPLKWRKGVYVPWGPVQKVQHYGWRLTQAWMVYMAVLIIALIYVKAIAPFL